MVGLINLGLTILGTVIKIASNNKIACEVCEGTLRVLDVVESDILSSRKLKRVSEDISDQISSSCQKILEYHSVNTARQEIIIDSLIDTINQTCLTYELVFRKKVNSEAIYQLLLASSKKYSLEFDPREQELYEHLLHHISEIIINAALASPDFANHGIKYLVNNFGTLQFKIDEVLEKVDQIDKLVKAKEYDSQQYERKYRNNIKDRYGWIRLLGANSLNREEKRYQLSIAYVTLEMSKNDSTSEVIDTDSLFDGSKVVWLEGEAGSGKTTFLQWIAVASASNDTEKLPLVKNTLPIMVELRSQNCKKLSLKQAVDSVMIDSDCSMPTNWLSNYLESGNAIILIDGVDEVRPEERDDVLYWIEEQNYKYPNARIIITSRPQIDKKLEVYFDDIKILPMTRAKIDVFLDYWHRAVLVEKLGVSEADAIVYKNKLSAQIDNSDSIRKLVANPLLCAMICALSYRNGSIISTQRNELYDDCCKMLFGNRDQESEVHAYDHISLSYDEKKIILAQIAYWMMKNGEVVADVDAVINCIDRTKRSLRIESQGYNSRELFRYFLERSGILRTPEKDKIDFIHKSFQDYLSAYEVYREDDWGFIANNAHNITWYETLILSMGFASERKSQQVIRRILDQHDEKSIIIAAACASNTSSLSPKLRNTITQQLSCIIPPKSASEANRLARAGDFAVPFLKYNANYSVKQNRYCLATLNKITSVAALSAVATHLRPAASKEIVSNISKSLSYYTSQEIRSSGIQNAIINYVCESQNPKKLFIPELFLDILDGIMDSELTSALSKVTDLSIVDFHDELSNSILSMFQKVESLTVNGEFSSLNILSELSSKINSLTICDSSKQFEIYDLNQYRFPSLRKLYFHSAKWLYIDGSDLDSLYGITELGLYLYNEQCEVSFANFPNFRKLEKFDFYSDFVYDLDFQPFFYEMDIKHLSVMIPSDTSQFVQQYLETELEDYIRHKPQLHFNIRKFTYPFGSL
jgi:hypothetical protein